MKKFFCFGKKDFCYSVSDDCIGKCSFFDGSGGEYREPSITNAEWINAMTIEEKAAFLSSIAYGRETPWSEPFYAKFCDSCPTVTCTVEGYDKPMDLNECDFVDGKCPHGSDIEWWLQQPAEEK